MKNSLSFVEAIATVTALNSNTFFADEIGLNGGRVRALSTAGVIEKTGNTKLFTILIKEDEKEITVNEWKINRNVLEMIASQLEA